MFWVSALSLRYIPPMLGFLIVRLSGDEGGPHGKGIFFFASNEAYLVSVCVKPMNI